MKAFLVERLGCESIDDLPLTGDQKAGRKADFFRDERGIVIEVKSLVDDREHKVRELLKRERVRADWPVFKGEYGIREVLESHPRGDEIRHELFKVCTLSVQRAAASANQQVKETKRTFQLDEAMGVLVLLNEAVDILDPRTIGAKIATIIKERREDGTRRLQHLDAVILVSFAHVVLEEPASRLIPVMAIPADNVDEADWPGTFEAFFIREWSAFLGKPLQEGGRIRTAEEAMALRFDGRRPPTVFDGDPLPGP